jgi:excinuclease ABC subunit A
VCKGKRYDRETLEIKFKGKSIADVLDMTVEEATELFKAVPAVRDRLETLKRVGLGYIHVGQQATTLSGGEAQRVKLSKELSRRATGRTLYILDEPTTGLHFHDVAKLLDVLHELADQGNTVVVIEHNLEVIKTADWIVDLGPEGGDAGGQVVAVGTPAEIAANPRSYTGQYLTLVLARRPSGAKRPAAAEPQAAE